MSNIQDKITRRENLRETLEDLQYQVDRLDYEILREMDDMGAMKLPHPDFEVTQKVIKTTFDVEGGKSLLEIEQIADELVDSGAYIPEHEETRIIPAKFNMTRLKKIAKYGGKASDIIEENTNRIYGLEVKKKG